VKITQSHYTSAKKVMLGNQMTTAITFVVAVNSRQIYEDNFLASLCFEGGHPHQIIVQEGFRSAVLAYNDAIDKSLNDLIVFAHQDVLFPREWVKDLQRSLERLDESDSNWGVLGCYGEPLYGKGRGYIYSPYAGVLGNPFDHPAPVQTLDEIVLIIRKSQGLRFNERLPHFHFYGAEICMTAAKRGMKSYAISALCIHNSQQNLVLPKEFYESYAFTKRNWKGFLPIRTTCIKVTRFDWELYARKLHDLSQRYIKRKEVGATRVKDARVLFRQIESVAPASEDDARTCQ
jgi:hypothetical protein